MFSMFSNLKSNMDRFIEIILKIIKRNTINLKSNMERFIDVVEIKEGELVSI